MRKQLFFSSYNEWFLFLLPLFFVFHGYIDNLQGMHFFEALALVGEYILVTLIIFGNSFLLLRSQRKAALFTFAIMFFHLFFGAVHDVLKNWFPGSLITQYGFILPTTVVTFIFLFIGLRRLKRPLTSVVKYLNLVLLLLIIIDVPRYLKAASHKQPLAVIPNTVQCDTCSKPDVYLIIADEYADSASLQQIFGFNNNGFQNALREKGFHIIPKSRSNYNYTPFAMASLLQMNYLQGIEGRNSSMADKNICYQAINNSALWGFFKEDGYELKNYSIFNMANIPTQAPQNYILMGTDMVVSQTFLSRLNRDVRYHLLTNLRINSEVNRIAYFMNRCNQLLLSDLLDEAKTFSYKPKFVYTHLTMPHYPYYFHKDGTAYPVETLEEGKQVRQDAYLEYLQYSNTLFLEIIERILKASEKPPIIIFMGDHGFREFSSGFEEHSPLYFMNLNAVYLPNQDYSRFYDNLTSVNEFRILLNTSFGQHLPLLKDSSILLHE